MPEIRRSNKTLSAERVRAMKALATKIDRDERAGLSKKARAAIAEHEVLAKVLATLKAAREGQALSLAEIAALSGIDKANLSRLENSADANPTIGTLSRYARALGLVLRIDVAASR